MSIKTIVRAAVAGLILIGAAQGVSAGENAAMAYWKAKAGKLVSHAMRYPYGTRFQTYDDSFATVHAVIDRDGRILEARIVKETEESAFNRETKRFVRRLGALPALPENFDGDRALVRMHLIYAETERGVRQQIASIVETRELAAADAPVELAGLPVIDLVAGGR